MLHNNNPICLHYETCRCSLTLEHVTVTFSCVCTHCDHIQGTCLCCNTLAHVSFVCTAHDCVVGTCRCNMSVNCFLVFSYVILSPAHASATKPWHMFPSYILHMIVSLALVAATCPCQLFHRVILGDFVPGTCLCYNTLLHVLLVCIAL